MDVAAVSRPACKWCEGYELLIIGELFGDSAPLYICLRCDSAPATNPGNRLWATAPNAAGTKNGWWLPPREWTT